MSSVAQNVSSVAQNVSSVAQNVSSVAQNVSSVAQNVSSVAQNVSSVAQNVSSVAQNVSSVAQNVSSVAQNVSSVAQNVSSVAQNVSSVAQNVSSVAQNTENELFIPVMDGGGGGKLIGPGGRDELDLGRRARKKIVYSLRLFSVVGLGIVQETEPDLQRLYCFVVDSKGSNICFLASESTFSFPRIH